MFNFFVKKVFLADYLSNFVDIHNHILPGIDDGAETVDDSLALVKRFGEIGINRFIATPHIMANYYPNDRDSINTALESLKTTLLEHKMKDVSIEAAAEHMIDNNFEQLIENGQVMPIRNEFLLVEMSYLQPSINFKEAISKTTKAGYYPILAHPERYNFIHFKSQRYHAYKKKGVYFQLNLLSLGNYYDKDTQKKARRLIDDGLIDFVASDVHSQKHLDTLIDIEISKNTVRKILPIIARTIDTFY